MTLHSPTSFRHYFGFDLTPKFKSSSCASPKQQQQQHTDTPKTLQHMSCWCVEHVVCEMHVAFSIYGQLSYTFPTEIESQLARDFHTHAPFLESVAFVALCCLQNRRRSPVHHCDGLGATSSATEFPCWIFCGVFDGTFNYANPNTAVRVIMMYDMGPEGPLFLSYKPDEFDRKLTIISPCLLDWL